MAKKNDIWGLVIIAVAILFLTGIIKPFEAVDPYAEYVKTYNVAERQVASIYTCNAFSNSLYTTSFKLSSIENAGINPKQVKRSYFDVHSTDPSITVYDIRFCNGGCISTPSNPNYCENSALASGELPAITYEDMSTSAAGWMWQNRSDLYKFRKWNLIDNNGQTSNNHDFIALYNKYKDTTLTMLHGYSMCSGSSQTTSYDRVPRVNLSFSIDYYPYEMPYKGSSCPNDYYLKTDTLTCIAYCPQGYEVNDTTHTCKIVAKPINLPDNTKISKPSLTGILDSIWQWLLDLWNKLLQLPHSITGVQEPLVGSTETYQISIALPPADTNYSDGTYQYRTAKWFVVKNDRSVLVESDWKDVVDTYVDTATITYPSNPENYMLVAVVYQYDMVYNTTKQDWSIAKQDIIAKEGISIKTKLKAIDISSIAKPSTSSLIDSLISWLKGLFCSWFHMWC